MSRLRVVVMLALALLGVIGVLVLRKPSAIPVTPVSNEKPAIQGVPALPASIATAANDLPIVVWSADTKARFEPCGCVAGMFGGLVRRANLLARVSPDRALSLELGGWNAGPADYQRLHSEFYLRGLRRAEIDAVGIGRAEVELGAAALAKLLTAARSANVAVVCANLHGVDVDRVVFCTVAGRRFAVTSVVSAQAAGEGLSVDDPADALAEVLNEAKGAPLVVMADLDEEQLVALAKALPSLALVVGGAVTSPTISPIQVGGVRVVHVANHGKTVGWWAWDAPLCEFELIPDSLPDAPALRDLVHEYQAQLGKTTLTIDAPGTSLVGYAGTASCQTCHSDANAIHTSSRHAHAFATVAGKGYQNDPECLRCHVTGLGRSGGFARGAAIDWKAAVSCESCHGPGAEHVAAATAGRKFSTIPVSPATCAGCHDGENSPHFNYSAYWPKIAHGH